MDQLTLPRFHTKLLFLICPDFSSEGPELEFTNLGCLVGVSQLLHESKNLSQVIEDLSFRPDRLMTLSGFKGR